MEKYKLIKPVTINNKKVKELPYDFDLIGPQEFALASNKVNGSESGARIDMFEGNYAFALYLALYAVVAATDGYYSIADLEMVKGADMMNLARLGRNFTLKLGGRQEETSDESVETSPEPTSQAS